MVSRKRFEESLYLAQTSRFIALLIASTDTANSLHLFIALVQGHDEYISEGTLAHYFLFLPLTIRLIYFPSLTVRYDTQQYIAMANILSFLPNEIKLSIYENLEDLDDALRLSQTCEIFHAHKSKIQKTVIVSNLKAWICQKV